MFDINLFVYLNLYNEFVVESESSILPHPIDTIFITSDIPIICLIYYFFYNNIYWWIIKNLCQ